MNLGKPYRWLSRDARRWWEELAPEMDELTRPVDRALFARYCDGLARYWAGLEHLDELGSSYEVHDKDGELVAIRSRPEAEQLGSLARELARQEEALGLSPAARHRMRVARTPREGGEVNPLTRLKVV